MPLRHRLEERFNDIPLIICGPIVRRVEPELVSVWVALKEHRMIEMELYTGYCSPSGPGYPEKNVVQKSNLVSPIEIGKNLYIGLVTIESPGFFTPGGIFSYDLLFSDANHNIKSLIDLTQNDGSGTQKSLLKAPHLLGFIEDQLPSFIVPPSKLEDLRIAHGSCRKPSGKGRDALASLAEIMLPDFKDPERVNDPKCRPHVFFHTGDQIYADDCSDYLIQHYTDTGNFLLNKIEQLPFPLHPETSYLKPISVEDDYVWLKAAFDSFPPGRRATNFYSGFTGDQGNHLFTFAEFCAAYLYQWCDALWPPELPDTEQLHFDRLNDQPAFRPYLFPLITTEDKNEKGDKEENPDIMKSWNDPDADRPKIYAGLIDAEQTEVIKAGFERFKSGRERVNISDPPRQKELVLDFKKDLKAVRQVLANVSSIMSFDDHDVTDDWYLNGAWCKQALGTRLGETIIRNGLMAYALFQAWGNDPKGWSEDTGAIYDRRKLLSIIPEWINHFKNLDDAEVTPITPKRKLDGVDYTLLFNEAFAFNDFEKTYIPWHCTLRLGEAKVYVLDTRTRRDFSAGLNFPPNLISSKALAEQIPQPAIQPTGIELSIIISGAPVLGLAAIEAIGQPIVPRILDVVSMFTASSEEFNIKRRMGVHRGSASLDVEHWTLHQAGYEAFLKRCAALKKVLFLAGDVHYGITAEMDYWVKGQPEAARFVQMVSSSLKNIRPQGSLLGILPSGIAENALAGGLNREFTDLTTIGWEDPDEISKIKLVAQTTLGQFEDAKPHHYPTRFATALAKKPVHLLMRDWPLKEFPPENDGEPAIIASRIAFKDGTPLPSFRWRMNILKDTRPDSIRFDSLSSKPDDLTKDFVDGEFSGDAYDSVVNQLVKRAAFYSRSHINRTVNWYSHVAIIDFLKKDNKLFTRQSMYFKPALYPPHEDYPGTFEKPYLQNETSLEKKPDTEQPDLKSINLKG